MRRFFRFWTYGSNRAGMGIRKGKVGEENARQSKY